jgi:chromosome partitioning protein
MIFSIASQKGDTGKTTTSISTAAWLARSGQRILLIDMDSQANSSKVLLPHYQQRRKDDTLCVTVLQRRPISIHETSVPNLWIAQCSA